jgi:hypothetical protein
MRHSASAAASCSTSSTGRRFAALPVEPYVPAEWRQRRVALDYHVDVDGHYYSVPHRLLRQRGRGAHHQRTVELFLKASVSPATCWAAPAAATPP